MLQVIKSGCRDFHTCSTLLYLRLPCILAAAFFFIICKRLSAVIMDEELPPLDPLLPPLLPLLLPPLKDLVSFPGALPDTLLLSAFPAEPCLCSSPFPLKLAARPARPIRGLLPAWPESLELDGYKSNTFHSPIEYI